MGLMRPGIPQGDYAIHGVQYHPESFLTQGGGRADAQLLDGGASIMTVRILSLTPCVCCLWGQLPLLKTWRRCTPKATDLMPN